MKRSLHDRVILTLATIAALVLIVAGCLLDSQEHFELFFGIVCVSELFLIWFMLANRRRIWK